ncbi:hypothetical protein FQA39_LY02319 [Lamprigera yunnana]|nr:hypothetical protein FQA39_LY02319 [Lamprigera yunnana]
MKIIKGENEQLKKFVTIQDQKIEFLERQCKRNNVVIRGIEHEREEKEHITMDKLEYLFQKMNVKINMEMEIDGIKGFTTYLKYVSLEPAIKIEHSGAVTIIGINRTCKRNCIDTETAKALQDAVENFEKDEKSFVGVLYGEGGNFCAGYDLNKVAEASNSDMPSLGFTHRLIKKPLIAAVSGYAVATGMELALMCDLRVMEETAIMGVYSRRFGFPLIDGGTVRLTAMVGLSRALDLILTGRSLPAKEAFEWGLANRIVACGTSLGQALNLATSLVKFPQDCLLSDRKSTYNSAFASAFDQLLKYETTESSTDCIMQEAIEGAKKFSSGIGKHGKTYNLTKKEIPDWENENVISENK